MLHRILTRALDLTPAALTRIIDDVKPDRYHDRVADDRFNLVEMVAHLADTEDVFFERMRLAHEHPKAAVEGFDPDQRAIEKHYATRDLHHELEVFTNRRRDTLDYITGLPTDELSRSIIHSTLGELTILDLAHFIAAHDLMHLEQATHYLR